MIEKVQKKTEKLARNTYKIKEGNIAKKLTSRKWRIRIETNKEWEKNLASLKNEKYNNIDTVFWQRPTYHYIYTRKNRYTTVNCQIGEKALFWKNIQGFMNGWSKLAKNKVWDKWVYSFKVSDHEFYTISLTLILSSWIAHQPCHFLP